MVQGLVFSAKAKAIFTIVMLMLASFGGLSGADAQHAAPIPEQIESPMEEIDTHAAEGHGESAGLPQFDLTTAPSQIFWLAVTFGILYFYFARKTLPTLSSTLESRRSTIRNDIKAAEKLSADVEKTKTEYETAMEQARTDARHAVIAVENTARTAAENQSSAFKEKSMKAVADLEAKAAAEKTRIMGDLEKIAADVAGDIITSLTGMSMPENDISQAVQARLSPDNSPQNKKKAA